MTVQESGRLPSWGLWLVGYLSQRRLENSCLDSHSLFQQFCFSSIQRGEVIILNCTVFFTDPSLPMEMVHLSPLGLASLDGCSFRHKGKETNATSAFSKLPVNRFACSSWGTNWNSNWPLWPPLIIQGAVISRGLIHFFAWVLADCRIITENSS